MQRRPRILITRTRHQAAALATQLDALGAETILISTIELTQPTSFAALDAALQHLDNFHWLIFTSANAVHSFVERVSEQGISLSPNRIAVIGPATAKAVAASGLLPRHGSVLVPKEYVAESLAQALLEQATDGPQNYLLVRAEEARDVIPSVLEAAGHRVTIAPAYRNITPPDAVPALQHAFTSPEAAPEIVTFTSSSTARNLFAVLETAGTTLPAGTALASIGPITSATLRELGHEPTFEAAEPTIHSLVAAIAAHLQQ